MFVPAAYMEAKKNKDGTYTCKLIGMIITFTNSCRDLFKALLIKTTA